MKIRSFIFAVVALVGCLAPITAEADLYWDRRVSLFDKIPVQPGDIVFLGNSITDGGEFNELFDMENIKNRGISSDIMPGVEKRLHQVTDGKPAKIFLLIGINDISHGHSVDNLANKYEHLVKRIRQESPESELYLQSVMPINNDFKRYKSLYGKEQVIPALNKRIEKIAAENGAVFIDLWPVLADPKTGKLKKEYTNDGLHLTGPAYRAWTNAIRPYVVSGETAPQEGSDEKKN